MRKLDKAKVEWILQEKHNQIPNKEIAQATGVSGRYKHYTHDTSMMQSQSIHTQWDDL